MWQSLTAEFKILKEENVKWEQRNGEQGDV